MSTYSETILPQNTHPGDSSNQTITGIAYKGDGYYSRTDGFHTVQYNLTGFTGSVIIQATLATNPSASDWFSLSVTQHTGTGSTGSFLYNFTGNYVWVRAQVAYTDGTINSILLNHWGNYDTLCKNCNGKTNIC